MKTSEVKSVRVGNHVLYCGHVLDVLRQLPDESVHMVLTSPPYWMLRSYKGNQQQVWGGASDCSHEWDKQGFCVKGCGAWFGALGHEPTPELYVQHLVEVFRECRRVLRSDGTLWLNIGDSYIGSGKAGSNPEYWKRHTMFGKGGWDEALYGKPTRPKELPAGNLALVPQRLAIALQQDGWIIRSIIIWAKGASGQKELLGQVYDACLAEGIDETAARAIVDRLEPYVGNPLPESIKTRPTRAHEYIILASKSDKPQFWTHPEKHGVRRKPPVDKDERGLNKWQSWKYYYDWFGIREAWADMRLVQRAKQSHEGFLGKHRDGQAVGLEGAPVDNPGMSRNLRDVWFIPTEPSDVPHYAVMPSRLAALCIKAGSSVACCPKCGAPYVRQLESRSKNGLAAERIDNGFVPTCNCQHKGLAKCVVLDPFGGVGTTSLVCEDLGRGSIYIDVSEEYWQIAIKRLSERLNRLFA